MDLPGAAPITPSFTSAARAHGVMMFLAFGVLMPVSAYIARYARRAPRNGPRPWWYPFHILFNGLALLFFVAGFTISIFISGDSQWMSAHKKLGLALAVMLLLQSVWGISLSFIHNRFPSRRRDTVSVDWPHWVLGWSILTLGFVNISLGLYLSTGTLDDYRTSTTVRVLWFVWMSLVVLTIVITEIIYRFKGGNDKWAASSKDLKHTHEGRDEN